MWPSMLYYTTCRSRRLITKTVLSKAFVCFVTLVTLTLWIFRHYGVIVSWRLMSGLLQDFNTTLTCNIDQNNYSVLLGPTREDDLRKIKSYKFEGIQSYIDELFPPYVMAPRRQQKLPILLSAVSSSHFGEVLKLVKNLNDTLFKNYRDIKFIIFDIGLKNGQLSRLKAICRCEIRRFPFEDYPLHVRNLMNYTWKTIVIQTIAKEHPFLFWMDTSVRFKTGELDPLIADVKRLGLMCHDRGSGLINTVAERTHRYTFNFLEENPCAFTTQSEKEATMILLYANPFITEYFLKPWVSCALSLGCMDPGDISLRFLLCRHNELPFRYQLCHRFDQSVLGILFTRLFHQDMASHAVSSAYYDFIRGDTK